MRHLGIIPGATEGGALDQPTAPGRGMAMAAVAKEEGATIRALLKGLVVSLAVALAVSLALSMVMRDAASTTPVAPARADGRAVAPGEQVADKPLTSSTIELNFDSLEIREAHSDGGYRDWLERQPANGGTGGH